jgi:hypothetical protein
MERWSVFSDFRREPIVGVLTSPSKQVVRQHTNGHVKPWELKPQQKDLMQVLRRPVETIPQDQTFIWYLSTSVSGHCGKTAVRGKREVGHRSPI